MALVYWGRQGGGAALLTRIARAMTHDARIDLSVSYSLQSEIEADELEGICTFPIQTFAGAASFIARSLTASGTVNRLIGRMREAGIDTIVTIMPHVWGGLLVGAAHRAGIRTVLIVHDADPHPGERRPILDFFARREIRKSDFVVTLSDHVAERLLARRDLEQARLIRLYHPILHYAPRQQRPAREGPFRLLFFGRILPYKGLPLLLQAFHGLRTDGVDCSLVVAGRGRIDATPALLEQQDLTIESGWIAPARVGDLLARADAMVLPYLEASQSGVVAAAYGSGLPVVATAVGGLAEQVMPGKTGVLAEAPTPEALAAAIRKLVETPGLYETCRAGVVRYADAHSPARFAVSLTEALLDRSSWNG